MTRERILVLAHAHPDFQKGGGELAAWHLCRKYREDGHRAVFLGCVDQGRGPTGAISMRREDDYTWEQAADTNTLHTLNTRSLHTNFADFVRAVRPDRVHLHHYFGLGLETFFMLKRLAPEARIWLTLHEYAAICPHHGQMIRPETHELCYRSSPQECRRCVPDCTSEALWLRTYFLQRAFALVDRFIAPSAFLKRRYAAWGLEADRISVEENWLPPLEKLPPRPLAEGESRNRFGFFGQITPFKGLDVLLEALMQLPRARRRGLVLEVNGANLNWFAPDFQERIRTLLGPLMKEGVVQWRGPYQREQLRERMSSIDWVVVPSIWWENSPVVIQEALALGRPCLVSDIGGMAEKVRDGVNGIHVPVGDRWAWAQAMLRCSARERGTGV